MRRPTKPFSVPRLADHQGGKVAVICEKCGMKRRYDATKMLRRIGDVTMPALLIDIARAEGCPQAGSKGDDRCWLHYDLEFAPMWKK